MESGFESQISEQKSTLAEKEKKIEQILKEKAKLDEKSAALQNKLDESNQVTKEVLVKSKIFFIYI